MPHNPDYDPSRPKPERPVVVIEREWAHGPTEKYCYRKSDPVFTAPDKIAGPCGGCGEDSWESRGIVKRDKNSGRVLERDGKKVV